MLAGDLGDDAKLTIYEFEIENDRACATGRGIVNSKFLIVNFAAAALLLLILGSAEMIGSAAALLRRGRAAARVGVGRGVGSGCGSRRARRCPGTAGGRCRGSACATRPTGRRAACVAIAVIAAATFILISVGAFRRDGASDWSDPRSGTGGYPLLVETMLPLADRSQQRRRPRAARPRRSADDIVVEPFRAAARRRCELLEPVRADGSRASSASGASSSRQGRFAFAAHARRRGARQPVASARARAGRRRDPGDRRRELDDLRPPQVDRRRDRRRPRRRAGPAAPRRGACPTASSRASC